MSARATRSIIRTSPSGSPPRRPPDADLGRVRRAYSVSDAESMETARLLLKNEGVLAGSSSGTLLAAALRYCREQTTPKRVVTLIPDSGSKYLSKVYNDYWMAD